MILVFAYFLNYYLNRTFAFEPQNIEKPKTKTFNTLKSLGFFPDPCPEGFEDIDPDSILEYDTGNCIKVLPENSYGENEKKCKELGGNLAVPLSVEHNRRIAEVGMTHLNKNEIKLRPGLKF